LLVNGVSVPLTTAYYLGAAIYDFGALDVEFTIRNDGDETLTLPSDAVTKVSGDDAIEVTAQPSTLSLAPGASATFTVTLSDLSLPDGLRTAVYTISSADAGVSINVTLTGYAAGQPANTVVEFDGGTYYDTDSLPNLGTINWDDPPLVRTVTIRNISTVSLHLTAPVQETSAQDEFAVAQQPSLEAIDPGNTRDFLVSMQYDDDFGLIFGGQITIYSDDPDGDFLLYLSGYINS